MVNKASIINYHEFVEEERRKEGTSHQGQTVANFPFHTQQHTQLKGNVNRGYTRLAAPATLNLLRQARDVTGSSG